MLGIDASTAFVSTHLPLITPLSTTYFLINDDDSNNCKCFRMNNYLVTYNYIIVIRWIKCRTYIEITSIDFQKGNEVDFPEVLEKSDAEKKVHTIL